MPVNSKKNKESDFQSLYDAYIIFLQELEDFEKKELELGGRIRNVMDQDKINNVLQNIVNLKE